MQSYDDALKRFGEFETAREQALKDLRAERDRIDERIRQLESFAKPKRRGRPPKTKKGSDT